jgi:hypothetical protein
MLGLPWDPLIVSIMHPCYANILHRINLFWNQKVQLRDADLRFNPLDDAHHRVIMFSGFTHAIKKRFAKPRIKQSHSYLAAVFIVLAILMENRRRKEGWANHVKRFYDNARKTQNTTSLTPLQVNTTPTDLVNLGLARGSKHSSGFRDCYFSLDPRFTPEMWDTKLETKAQKVEFLKDYFNLFPEEYKDFPGFD